MKALIAWTLGLLFGLGLLTSGMTDPNNVIDFLDVAGAWNPALAFVMSGAIVIATPLFAIARRRGASLLGDELEEPSSRAIDEKLLIGAAIFGIGWGLAGICPGPSIVLLGQSPGAIWPFLAGAALGVFAARAFAPSQNDKSKSSQTDSHTSPLLK